MTIQDCGNWRDYKWDPKLPEFARVNVIYGGNGAGKTSLSASLDALTGDRPGANRVSIDVDQNGGRVQTDNLAHASFKRLFVFSEEFVNRSHRLTSDSAEMAVVLTVGERPVEAEIRLEELRPKLDGTMRARTDAIAKGKKLAKQITREHQTVSDLVVTAVGAAGGRYASRGSFSAGTVSKAFDASRAEWVELDEATLSAQQGLVKNGNSEPVPTPELSVLATDDLADRIQSALRKSPASLVLDTLGSHPEATSWVEDGLALHEGSVTCIFCSGQFTAKRKSDIEKHFSDEVTVLQDELDSLIAELDGIGESVEASASKLVARGLLFADLRPAYDDVVGEFKTSVDKVRQRTAAARKRLQFKRANVLSTDDAEVLDVPDLDGSAVTALYDKHNDRVATHGELVQAAALAVERHFLMRAESAVGALVDEAAGISADELRLASEIADLEREIDSYEAVEGDPGPSAKALTEQVARLLGRNELQFVPHDNRYRIMRRGEPAHGLSAGERTAITLVHFLEMVARFDASGGKAIVVIDDPVSSLDSDIFVGVSTSIWTEAVTKDHIAQLFLLTHNFELFRQWDIQIEGLPGKGGSKSDVPAQFYEIKPKHRTHGAQTRREPTLVTWPPSIDARRKVRSTYHHAFIAVTEVKQRLKEDDSLENRLDAQLLFPNVIRRLLETFMAFKRPGSASNFNVSMQEAAELLTASSYLGDPDALRQRLTRYTHAYSHGDTPHTELTISPDEVQTAIGAVFTFMRHVDEEHFDGLCKVLKLNPEDLVEPDPPTAEGAIATGSIA